MSYSADVLASSPLYYWRLNETSGTSAADSVSTNTGTYVNCTVNQSGPARTGDPAVSLNGTTSDITTTTSLSNPGSTGYSLEAWFKTSATAAGVIVGFNSAQDGT